MEGSGEPATPPAGAVRNEQTKLLAMALNNTGVAVLVTGLISPIAGMVYGTTTPVVGHFWWLIAIAWLVTGLALHILGRLALRRLRP